MYSKKKENNSKTLYELQEEMKTKVIDKQVDNKHCLD